jgi:uncharacterized MnhB-related membrane protein
VSTRFGRPHHWTPVRFGWLGVAAAFGYLVLASTDLLVATAAGLAGALVAECVLTARSRRKPVAKVDTRAEDASAELVG